MLIAISKYTKPLTEVDVHRPPHVEFLKKQYAAGKLLASGRQDPPVGGVIIANNLTLEEFQAVLKLDPFAIAGVAEYKIVKFTPTMHDACLDGVNLD